MKNVVISMVAVAGLAAAASAEVRGTSVLTYQVRPVGAATWSTDITVAPGTQVEVRALVSWEGSGNAPAALYGAIFQPTVSNWNTANDSFVDDNTPADGNDFVASGSTTLTGGVQADSGNYGRIIPFSLAGIGTGSALRAHVNTVAGTTYMRIAQNSATNWVGVGTSSSAGNNVTGALGIPCVQRPIPNLVPSDPAPALGASNIEVFRFAVVVGGAAERVLTVDTPAAGIRDIVTGNPAPIAGTTPGFRGFTWASGTNVSAADLAAPVVTGQAFIRVPTPASLALLGLGGLVAGRRRR